MATRKHLFVAGVSTALLSLSAIGFGALSAPSDAHVTFQASGPGGLTIEGTTADLKVSEDSGNVVIDVPLANLNTGIDLRDHHMREKYLEVPKFPSATLRVARSALKVPAAGSGVEVDVPATLALHGQSRPVTVHYDAKADGAGFAAHGRFRVNMNDY